MSETSTATSTAPSTATSTATSTAIVEDKFIQNPFISNLMHMLNLGFKSFNTDVIYTAFFQFMIIYEFQRRFLHYLYEGANRRIYNDLISYRIDKEFHRGKSFTTGDLRSMIDPILVGILDNFHLRDPNIDVMIQFEYTIIDHKFRSFSSIYLFWLFLHEKEENEESQIEFKTFISKIICDQESNLEEKIDMSDSIEATAFKLPFIELIINFIYSYCIDKSEHQKDSLKEKQQLKQSIINILQYNKNQINTYVERDFSKAVYDNGLFDLHSFAPQSRDLCANVSIPIDKPYNRSKGQSPIIFFNSEDLLSCKYYDDTMENMISSLLNHTLYKVYHNHPNISIIYNFILGFEAHSKQYGNTEWAVIKKLPFLEMLYRSDDIHIICYKKNIFDYEDLRPIKIKMTHYYKRYQCYHAFRNLAEIHKIEPFYDVYRNHFIQHYDSTEDILIAFTMANARALVHTITAYPEYTEQLLQLIKDLVNKFA
jgi:hypothetical protein